MTPFDPEALTNAYATVTIPDIVREDIAASYFFDRCTLVKTAQGLTDVPATMVNEGMRIAFKAFLSKMDRARKAKSETQTKAVSATAEESA